MLKGRVAGSPRKQLASPSGPHLPGVTPAGLQRAGATSHCPTSGLRLRHGKAHLGPHSRRRVTSPRKRHRCGAAAGPPPTTTPPSRFHRPPHACGLLRVRKISPSPRPLPPSHIPRSLPVPSRDPAGPPRHAVARRHGSGSAGLAAGMGHAWAEPMAGEADRVPGGASGRGRGDGHASQASARVRRAWRTSEQGLEGEIQAHR